MNKPDEIIDAQPIEPEFNPWPGLASYTEQQHANFCGRKDEAEELVRLINRDTLTVLFGRSGLGKTSLLRAGVVPGLRGSNIFPVFLRLDYSNHKLSPVEQVKELLIGAAHEQNVTVEDVVPHAESATLWEFMHSLAFWGAHNDLMIPLLVFDQFEEVFTLGQESAGAIEFLEQLADLAENRVPKAVLIRVQESGERLPYENKASFKIVISLREDFVSRLDSLKSDIPSIMLNRFSLAPLNRDKAVQVVSEPGSAWITPSVAREIVSAAAAVSDDGTGGRQVEVEPAYLSVLCHELFRKMQGLSLDAITSDLVTAEQGGIIEALYDRSLQGMDLPVHLFIENRLLTPTGFRASVPVKEAAAEKVSPTDLNTLVNRRLLRIEDRLGTRHIELSHDLLTKVVQGRRDQRRADKERNELKRQLHLSRIRFFIAGAGALLLILGVASYLLLNVKHYTVYSKSFKKVLGVAYPLDVIGHEAVSHRGCNFRFEKKGLWNGGEIIAVDMVDADGIPTYNCGVTTYLNADNTSGAPKFSRMEFLYDDDGKVNFEVARNKSGEMVWGLAYAPPRSSNALAGLERTATFLGPDGSPKPQRNSKAETVRFHYDKNGFELRLEYLGLDGNPAPGPDGAYGNEYEYDMAGHRTRNTSLNSEGKPSNDNAGNAAMVSEYDREGNIIKSTALDAQGRATRLITDNNNWSIQLSKIDEWGNWTEYSHFDADGRPMISIGDKAHLIKLKRDSKGNVTAVYLFDTRGRPINALGEVRFHEIRRTYDAHNNETSYAQFDTAGRPVKDAGGGFLSRYGYDKDDYLNQIAYFDNTGEKVVPMADNTGLHRILFVNDKSGNVVSNQSFDIDDKPIAHPKNGCHKNVRRYNTSNSDTEVRYFDKEDKPCTITNTGIHIIRWTYDRFGNAINEEYFDVSGARTDSKVRGIQSIVTTYDDTFGKPTDQSYFDKDGNRKNDEIGVHRNANTYDERGLLTADATLDKDERFVGDSDGIAITLFSYNDKRQVSSVEFYGPERLPAINSEMIHRVLIEYDESGRRVKLTRYGVLGEIWTEIDTDLVTEVDTADEKGQIVYSEWRDCLGDLKPNETGYAIARYEYDDKGRTVRSRFFTPDDLPTVDQYGVSERRSIFNPDDSYVITHYDTAGKPTNSVIGYWSYASRTDSLGQIVTETFDLVGNLVLRSIGDARIEIDPRSVDYLRKLQFKSASVITWVRIRNASSVAQADLHVGDVLLDYEGNSFADCADRGELLVRLGEYVKGEKPERTLGVLRNGKRVEVTVPRGKLGAALMELTDYNIQRR